MSKITLQESTTVDMKKPDTFNRINALATYRILDTLPEPDFDNITQLAAYISHTAISLITLLDDKRQFIKSHYGIDARELPIEQSFCVHALNSGKDILVVSDVRKDKRFVNNPLVTEKPHIAFYAGTPLITPEGVAIGTLCVLDYETKSLDEGQQQALKSLAGQVMQLLELRRTRLFVEKQLYTYKERVKEQACLTAIANLNKPGITVGELLQQAVNIMPQGWQHVELACASITHGDDRYVSTACKATSWSQTAKRKTIGDRELLVTVSYPESLINPNGEAFLPEENQLLESIASTLCLMVDQLLASNQLRKNQLDLQYSYDELKKITDQSLDMICVLNQQGIFIKVSAAVEWILGYKPEELIGRPFSDFIHPEDLPKIMQTVADVEQGLIIYHHENRYIHKNGRAVPLSWSISRDNEEKLIYCIGRDASEILEATQKLTESEKRFRALVENGADVVMIFDATGKPMYASPSIKRVLGYNEDEALAINLFKVVHPEDQAAILEVLNKSLNNPGIPLQGHTSRIRHKDGSWRWIEATVTNMLHDPDINGIVDNFRDVTERVEALRKLQQVELLHENAARMARIGSWELDLVNTGVDALYWSPMTREIMEVDDDYNPTLTGGFEFYDDENQKKFRQATTELIKTGKEFDLELLVTTGKGNSRWIRCIGKSDRLDQKCLRIYGGLQDIHEYKLSKLELQRALEERNTVLESIGDAFFAVDRNWTVLYWNKEAEKVLGKKREDIIGKNLWQEYPNAVNLKFFSEYHRAMEEGISVQFDEYNPEIDQWFEVSAYPSEQGLSIYFKDVSIRKIAEREIQQSNERFEKIAEATNDAIWDFDAAKNELFWGQGFTTQFGYDLQSIKPSFNLLISLIHPEDRQKTLDKINRAMNDPKTINWFEEYRFLTAHGNYALVIDRAVFIRDEHGHVKRVVGAMTDITYRKEYEDSLQLLNQQLAKQAKDLELSNRELEQFAYIASHDLQEPLRMVTSFLTQLDRKYSNVLDEKAHQYIHFAVDGAKRMRQIILDLLEFSRVGRHTDTPEWIDLNELVNEITAMQRETIESKGANIHIDNLPALYIHRLPITQVFQNLIGNGLKYAKADVAPQINIKAEKQETHWLFSVQDNGIGIGKEYYDKIFIIFQRLHTRDQYSGTGIGLSIVKKIIENLGGRIWVESRIDQGSTFFFTLPHTLVRETRVSENVSG